jgi:hypothetical protein
MFVVFVRERLSREGGSERKGVYSRIGIKNGPLMCHPTSTELATKRDIIGNIAERKTLLRYTLYIKIRAIFFRCNASK